MKNPAQLLSRMNELFGGYRAEWLKDELFEVFTEPAFFPELKTRRACFLIGGRGTGKTTLLRALSYEGQYALSGSSPKRLDELKFVGAYVRIDLNKTAAFDGPELTDRQWVRLFGHYINLELASALMEYALWYERTTGSAIQCRADLAEDFCVSMHMPPSATVAALAAGVRRKRIELEAAINNVADPDQKLLLSLQGGPLESLIALLRESDALQQRDVYFLLDEYESLLPYQQQCVNTLVKYSGARYTFKVGMKELGLYTAATLKESETLSSPADYSRIDIARELEEGFDSFAASVVRERFRRVFGGEEGGVSSPEQYFPGLTEEEEAVRLGAVERAAECRERVLTEGATGAEAGWLQSQSSYEQAFCEFLAASQGTTVLAQVRAAMLDRQSFEQRRNNYGYSFLFTLRRRRAGVRKFYAGWPTLCSIAGANIRYLLHLVDQCVVTAAENLEDVTMPISPDTQTKAAQFVGRSILTDLEGESREGARLTKLVLGVGRVFQVMAATPEGHTPEVNQFSVRSDENLSGDHELELAELLRAAVMHLALRRLSGTKPTGDQDTRDWDFTPHPVFAPYFGYSHRKKRKIAISPSDLLALAKHPGAAVSRILREQNRSVESVELPEQMQLFGQAYESTEI